MRDTIKQHKHFFAGENDPVFKCPFFIARARPTFWPSDARYGIMATKKTLKFAHDRNRAKRLLRTWIRVCESRLNPELDYIFIVRRDILDAKLPEGVGLMKLAIKKLAISRLVL
jgi:ribonuclease P protein component